MSGGNGWGGNRSSFGTSTWWSDRFFCRSLARVVLGVQYVPNRMICCEFWEETVGGGTELPVPHTGRVFALGLCCLLALLAPCLVVVITTPHPIL